MNVELRLVSEEDAPVLAALLRVNREFLAPWEPVRPPEYFTENYQRRSLARDLTRYADDRMLPTVIVADREIVGRITVNDIVRGAFQSAHLGYWVGQAHGGRGIASAAVALAVRRAFGDLGLHRLQADTLVRNGASQRVLARNGFTRIGTAPRYLHIAGRWQDCHLHQLLHEPPG